MVDSPFILGISASHNGAACLLNGHRVIAAVQEERLTRIKRHRIFASRSSLAVRYCLSKAGISVSDLSRIVISVQGSARAPEQDFRLNPDLTDGLGKVPVDIISHHYAHAISALAHSGFEEAALLVVDGAGSPAADLQNEEIAFAPNDLSAVETISMYLARGSSIKPLEKHFADDGRILIHRHSGMSFFRSLGAMFQAASRQIFGQDMEAGKVMGLAPYGNHVFPPTSFFHLLNGKFLFLDDVPLHFSNCERWPNNANAYQDLACSTQRALEAGLLTLASRLRILSGQASLCYAGGVALNGLANELVIRSRIFENIYVTPAAEDCGVALGAAFYGLWQFTPRQVGSRLSRDEFGISYSSREISAAIHSFPHIVGSMSSSSLSQAVESIDQGEVVGWFQGGSELGPRALGQRSILYDPRRSNAKSILNDRVKKREAFRPFAPACLNEHAHQWFDLDGALSDSPFMLRVVKVREEKAPHIPGVVHVDGTARLQTVSRANNHLLYELLYAFYQVSGVPVLLNTSLNLAGEPIVETPEDAILCMVASGIDVLFIENQIVRKAGTFGSILDLYPHIIGTCLTLTQQMRGGLALRRPALYQATVRVNTRWGEVDQGFPSSYLWVLDLIDGVTNGHGILRYLQERQLVENGDGGIPLVSDVLIALKRLRIITFREEPVSKADLFPGR